MAVLPATMKVLIIEDNPGDVRLMLEMLAEFPGLFSAQSSKTLALALRLLDSEEFDAVLLDLGLPDSCGLNALTALLGRFPDLAVVVMTGLGDEVLSVKAVQLGAQDYLVKGQVDSHLLRRSLLYALERKKADTALKEKQLFLERLVQFNPAAISVLDIASGRILYSGGLGVALLGYEPGKGISALPESIFYPGDFHKMLAAASELQQTNDNGIRDVEIRVKAVDGRWRWLQIGQVIFKRDRNGSPTQQMTIARDITDQKQLEQELTRRSDELLAANHELQAFNYAVAHDLRAPLRHIYGFAEILAEEASSVLDETGQRHLQMIRDSVQHMGQLLEDLLSLSRIGRQELSKQICGLQSLVEEVVNGLKPEIKERQVEWRIGELPFWECDPGLMGQVMTNLLTNALKFTRSRRPAVIEVGQMMVEGEPVVFVRDNGVGFSMKYVDKLFGLFQRLHRQQDFEGTGVGLAIVQRIIHKHGGQVWAEGELNQGATFYFKLRSCAVEPEPLTKTRQVA